MFEGLDGVLTFNGCEDLERPLMAGSAFGLDIEGAEETDGVWTTTDPSVLEVTGFAGDWTVHAYAPGTVEVSVTLDTGESDRIAWEVVQAASATLDDPYRLFAIDLLAEAPEGETAGAIPPGDLGDPIQVWEGQAVAVKVTVADADGRDLAYSMGALNLSGVTLQEGQPLIPGAGLVTVHHEDSSELLRTDVVAVDDLTGATLDLAAWQPARDPAAVEGGEGGSQTLAYFMATVTDGEGERILRAPVEWSGRGIGEIGQVAEEPDREGLRLLFLREDQLDRYATAEICVVARLDTPDGPMVRSAWLTPEEVQVMENGHCDGMAGCGGCSASADDASTGWVLGAFALAAFGLRRRRRAEVHPSPVTPIRRAA